MCIASHAPKTPVVNLIVEYCELTTGAKGFKSNSKAFIDYGKGNEKLVDDQGEEMVFSSPVGALNYMHFKGWEVISTGKMAILTIYLGVKIDLTLFKLGLFVEQGMINKVRLISPVS